MYLSHLTKSALAALFLAGGASLSQAAPVNYVDTYYGGNDGDYNTDVLAVSGDTRFNISSMDVERVANNLIVTINTNYANYVGALGTKLGTLFIGDPTKLYYNNLAHGGSAPAYNNDVFTADTDRFSYAFDYDTANPSNRSVLTGTGSLYALDGSGTDVKLSQDVTTSGFFRQNQAVDIVSSGLKAPTDTGVNGTWTIGVGKVIFNISNFFALNGIPSTGLTLAWAMTCANDIILVKALIPGGNTPEVPVPAGLILLLSGLTGIGFLGRFKVKKPA